MTTPGAGPAKRADATRNRLRILEVAREAVGGYKQSGIGREGGLEVLDAYTQTKAVLIAL